MDGLISFITSSDAWAGTNGMPNRIVEHLLLCVLAVAVAAAIALPVGLYIGHTGKLALLGINIANIGRAIPSYAVMVMILPVALSLAPTLGYDPLLGLSFLPIFLAMVLLAIPPILVGAYAGLRDVDRDLVESARGMGLTERQILGRIELPLASPILVGGFRTAMLQVIATATIGAILAGGGLGRFIIDGISRRNDGMLYTGVLLVGGLAIGVDIGMSWLQRRLTPRGLRPAAGARPGGQDAAPRPAEAAS
ncbi:MAG: ABC transporter permease [Chloroflexota bacterium]